MKRLSTLQNLVQRHDPDRYLLSLFAPARHRAALWALYAFNHEIAKTRELVTETTMGLIRLQWWRDAIGEIYEGDKSPRQHEVVLELAKAIEAYDLPREPFDNLIYAREFDVEGVAPANIEGLMKYCEYTSVPLFDLTLKIVGQAVGQNGDNDTVLVDISKHYALIGVIRSVPYKLSQRQVLLPQDVLAEFNLNEQKLFNFKNKEDISKVIKTLVVDKMGKDKVRKDRRKQSIPPFMQKVAHMTALYEAQLRALEYDVFDPKMTIAPKFLALRLWAGF